MWQFQFVALQTAQQQGVICYLVTGLVVEESFRLKVVTDIGLFLEFLHVHIQSRPGYK